MKPGFSSVSSCLLNDSGPAHVQVSACVSHLSRAASESSGPSEDASRRFARWSPSSSSSPFVTSAQILRLARLTSSDPDGVFRTTRFALPASLPLTSRRTSPRTFSISSAWASQQQQQLLQVLLLLLLVSSAAIILFWLVAPSKVDPSPSSVSWPSPDLLRAPFIPLSRHRLYGSCSHHVLPHTCSS